jgi:hypothetical protein
MRAQVNMYRKIREAVDPIDPAFAMSAEHYGYDCLARYMDWALDYDVRNNPDPIRKVPFTLFRFYFPECKTAAFNNSNPLMPEYRLFNAWAVMHPNGPELYHTTLLENGDAFDSRDVEPLVRTLTSHVYAHRFSAEPKTIFTFFNAAGHEVDEEILAVEAMPGRHWVNLLTGEELPVTRKSNRSAVSLSIPDRKAACIAQLPVLLRARTEKGVLAVDVNDGDARLSLAITDSAGSEKHRVKARRGRNEISLAPLELPRNRRYVVKLFRGKYLRDLTSLAL